VVKSKIPNSKIRNGKLNYMTNESM